MVIGTIAPIDFIDFKILKIKKIIIALLAQRQCWGHTK